jgi:hypothetical protein
MGYPCLPACINPLRTVNRFRRYFMRKVCNRGSQIFWGEGGGSYRSIITSTLSEVQIKV